MTSAVEMSRDGDVAELVIDRPEARNAVSRAVTDGLDAAIGEVERSQARAVVLRGGGDRVFVSGGDLKELARVRDFGEAHEMAVRMRAVLDRLARLPIPVVAALNGDAYGGGGEVALACDVRIAADDVRMGFTQSQLGIMPAWGGIERLVSLVGRGRALYLLATGHLVRGSDLATWGLVEEVVARADFDRRWRELAHALCAVPREALVGIKAVADATVPWVRPTSQVLATEAFARTWVADEHWELAARADERRRRRAADASSA
jgi:enoyl-CoA hydratase/carnithine racemase